MASPHIPAIRRLFERLSGLTDPTGLTNGTLIRYVNLDVLHGVDDFLELTALWGTTGTNQTPAISSTNPEFLRVMFATWLLEWSSRFPRDRGETFNRGYYKTQAYYLLRDTKRDENGIYDQHIRRGELAYYGYGTTSLANNCGAQLVHAMGLVDLYINGSLPDEPESTATTRSLAYVEQLMDWFYDVLTCRASYRRILSTQPNMREW